MFMMSSRPDSADASGSSPQSGKDALCTELSQPQAPFFSANRESDPQMRSTNPLNQDNPYSLSPLDSRQQQMHETHLEITHTQRDAQSVCSK